MLKIQYHNAENILECMFSGRLDSIASDDLSQTIDEKLLELKKEEVQITQLKIVFDLRKVDYIASSFIRICIKVSKQVAPGNFSIINCDPFVKKTFKITGLDDVLNIQ